MLLQINDSKDKTLTVVQVMMFEYEEDSDKFKIWDLCDNTAIVQAKNSYDASSCLRSLYTNGRATLNDASINWDNSDE